MYLTYLSKKKQEAMIGRPKNLNKDHYFVSYINKAIGDDLIKSLREVGNDTLRLIEDLTEEHGKFAYAENKWTIKQVIRHIADAERVFAYRAFRFSRKDKTPLSGFDEDFYAESDNSDKLSLKEIKNEYVEVRQATMALFSTMDPDVLDFEGIASDLPITPRMLGWTIVGHNTHHLNVIRERHLAGSL